MPSASASRPLDARRVNSGDGRPWLWSFESPASPALSQMQLRCHLLICWPPSCRARSRVEEQHGSSLGAELSLNPPQSAETTAPCQNVLKISIKGAFYSLGVKVRAFAAPPPRGWRGGRSTATTGQPGFQCRRRGGCRRGLHPVSARSLGFPIGAGDGCGHTVVR